MTPFFSRAFWSERWTDLHCRLVGHMWQEWRDGNDGTWWRQCADCQKQQRQSYIDALIKQRQARREALARKWDIDP